MNVLVLSPHPDDDTIGCGGTIRQHVLSGDTVRVVYATSGELGVSDEAAAYNVLVNKDDKDYQYVLLEYKRKLRENEAGVTSQILGTQQTVFWRFPDGGLTPVKADWPLAKQLESVLRGADVVYCPYDMDTHPDHSAVCHAVKDVAAKNQLVYMYEVWTPLIRPDHFVDVTPYVTEKRAAIRAHKSQMANDFESAILALNHYRGLMHHQPAKMYAEAFQQLR